MHGINLSFQSLYDTSSNMIDTRNLLLETEYAATQFEPLSLEKAGLHIQYHFYFNPFIQFITYLINTINTGRIFLFVILTGGREYENACILHISQTLSSDLLK